MNLRLIGPEVEARLSWDGIVAALEAGHRLPLAGIADTFLYRGGDTLLSRAAWIDGLGLLVKAATVFPGNAAAGRPTVNGAVTLYSDTTGEAAALVDFHLVTKWKTAGDSLLAARRLARPESGRILICGAGTVAASMVDAYRSTWPAARIAIWNRTPARAAALAAARGAEVAADLPAAVADADIICTATMASAPLIRGEWLRPGQHLDLIGAYTPAMREVDDEAIARARVFVDARATTIGHIGELMAPIAAGVISAGDVQADYYDLDRGLFARRSEGEITLAKNGGGAHLDLMTAAYVAAAAGG